MSASGLPRSAFRRIAAAVIQRELGRLRDSGIGTGRTPAVSPPERRDVLVLDSLERMGVSTALAEMFGISTFCGNVEAAECLEDWLDCIDEQRLTTLTVQSSGSTGMPRRHTHQIGVLLAEASAFAQALPRIERVVALVPADHLYGLVWTALLPGLLQIPVIAATVYGLAELHAHDLIVGVPEHWAALARVRRHWPANSAGVNSAGPLPAHLENALQAGGLARLFDVYGSSETSGIAWREAGKHGYTLLPRWRLDGDPSSPRLIGDEGGIIELPDRIDRIDELRFALLGRRDHAVQIGGHNVYPERVAATLARHEEIADVAVRLGQNGRLKAFVVPAAGETPAGLESRLRQYAIDTFSPAERPTRFDFGHRLPSNHMGKPADWD